MWGFFFELCITWFTNPQFNARSESVREKASFRRLLPKSRCLVAVEGYGLYIDLFMENSNILCLLLILFLCFIKFNLEAFSFLCDDALAEAYIHGDPLCAFEATFPWSAPKLN